MDLLRVIGGRGFLGESQQIIKQKLKYWTLITIQETLLPKDFGMLGSLSLSGVLGDDVSCISRWPGPAFYDQPLLSNQWRNGTSCGPPPGRNFTWAPIFSPNKLASRGGGEKKVFEQYFLNKRVKNIFLTITSKKGPKNFPHPCLLKKGSKFHNFTNSCFRGPPVANFLALYN